jgi:hypothetical protein
MGPGADLPEPFPDSRFPIPALDMAPPRPQDFKAGFTGLAVAVVFLAVVIYGMVMFTNWYVTQHGETPAEQTTH